jgi:hypothetical protein
MTSYERSAFADKITAAVGAHAGRMNGAGRNITAIAGMKGFRFAIQHERHFAAENHVSRLFWMLVVGVEGVRAILPNIGVAKALFT